MQLEEGERLQFTVTGTVISEFNYWDLMANLPLDTEIGKREFVFMVLDNGFITRVDVTDDDLGMDVTEAKPKYWPPVKNDVWTDDKGNSWYAVMMDFGYRKGLRLRSYSDLGEVVRTAQWLLNGNSKLKLTIRGENFIED